MADKLIKDSLCYNCIAYGGNKEPLQLFDSEKSYREFQGKIFVVCAIWDPYMPVMKKYQCKNCPGDWRSLDTKIIGKHGRNYKDE